MVNMISIYHAETLRCNVSAHSTIPCTFANIYNRGLNIPGRIANIYNRGLNIPVRIANIYNKGLTVPGRIANIYDSRDVARYVSDIAH